MAEIDIELALTGFPKDQFQQLQKSLPQDYELEDKYDIEWGAVIRSNHTATDEINQVIQVFLEGLENIRDTISTNKGVMRIGVFYDTANYTFRMSCMKLLGDFGLTIEVSVYPSE